MRVLTLLLTTLFGLALAMGGAWLLALQGSPFYLLSGLLGKAGKGMFGGLGRQAVSSGMSFASTYALGHVANQYYAGGRQLSTDMLKNAYQHVMQDGRALQERYMPQMQETARGLNTAKIMQMVRGN